MRTAANWVIRVLPAIDATVQAAILVALAGTGHSFNGTLLIVLTVPFSQYLMRAFGVYDSHRIEGAG